MTTDINAVQNAYLSDTPTTGPPEASAELDDEAFLSLLMSQLQNQDPLDPMDSAQMLEQISSLNQVDQLQQANANLEALIVGMASLNNAASVDLVGKEVMVVGDTFTAESSSATVGYLLSGEADDVEVLVYDADDNLITTIQAGASEGGLETVDVSGLTEGQDYRIEVNAEFEGEEVSCEVAVSGVVEGLDFSEGFVSLIIGGQSYALDQVLQVMPEDGGSAGEVLAQEITASLSALQSLLSLFGEDGS